jgi:hypothetical protein
VSTEPCTVEVLVEGYARLLPDGGWIVPGHGGRHPVRR